MRRIGLAVVLALSLLAPLAVEAQEQGKVYRVGRLSVAAVGRLRPKHCGSDSASLAGR